MCIIYKIDLQYKLLFMKEIKIILVDDQYVFIKAMRSLLSKISNVKLIAEASNGQEFLDIIKKYDADIILMDIQMPIMDGIEATKKALQYNPDLKIIILTTFDDIEYVKSIIEIGACGYILKNLVNEKLMQAIRLALDGECTFSLIN